MGGKANVREGAAWRRRALSRRALGVTAAMTLACALPALSLIAAPAASAATDYTAGRPLAAVAHAPGDVEVYWRGADGYLWESAATGGQWRGAMRTPIGGLGSSPAATIGPGGADYVFWEGTNRALWEAWTTSGGWSAPTQIGMGPLGSQPTATSWGNSSGTVEIDVFWQGTDGNLWRGYYTVATGKWTGPTSLGMGALGSAPTAAAQASSSGPQIQVFWDGRDNDLWEGDTSGATKWTGPTNHGMGPLGSAPAVAAVSTTDEDVFWEGTNAKLWQGTWNGSSWSGPTAAGLGPMASAPTVAAASPDEDDIFWVGIDSNLWEAQYVNRTWTSIQSRGPMVAYPPAQTSPVPVTVTPPPTRPGPTRHVRVKIVMSWTWNGIHTRLRTIRFGHFPARGTILVTCRGRHCPKRLKPAGHRHLRALIRSLEARLFHAGQQLTIVIRAPGRVPERAQVTIRDGALPLAKLL
jgi:hypothetical protein